MQGSNLYICLNLIRAVHQAVNLLNIRGLTKPDLYSILYPMNAITYTEARANLAETITRVCDDHNPVIITKKNDKTVVMISLDDYESMEETAYLLRSSKNAKRLLESIRELETGKGMVQELIEP